jgi:C-terminal processing protease CtpA/Prc
MTFSTTSGQPIRQQIRTLHLPPSEEGVGISLAPHTQGGAVVTALLDRGAAKKDGRLSRGDKVLEVNEESVIHMRSEEVAARLRSLDDAREAIRLVVAHSEREGESQAVQDVIPEVMDSSGDELDEFEVELYKEGRGLGITIAGLVSEDTGDELKGLYITSINAQGAVGKDGRANVNDRILRVDGHSLRGLENMEAAAVLRNSGNPVRLVFGRPKTQEGVDERETEEEETGKTDDINGEQVHLHDNGIQETSDGDLGNGIREAPEREDSLAATNEEDVELIRKWKNVMGPNYDIKVSSEMRVWLLYLTVCPVPW